MKTLISFTVLLCTAAISYGQFHYETNGNPAAPVPVNAYTGWSDPILTYTGTAEVQNANPSNYTGASGAGNIFFTNTAGTYFQVGGLPRPADSPIVVIDFGMYGYDTSQPTQLNELVLEVSMDSGLTWSPLPYHRFFQDLLPPQPWDIFTGHLPHIADLGKLLFRFTQTTATKTFRIDDIRILFPHLLPVRLNYFSAAGQKDKVTLQWKAFTSSDKDAFVIEKSPDAVLYTPIQQVLARGYGEFVYTCSDQSTSNSWYRLKMLSQDGQVVYSNTVYVRYSPQPVQIIYPNPAKNRVYIKLNDLSVHTVTLILTDASGRQRVKHTLSVSNGIVFYDFSVHALETGLYYLTVAASNERHTEQLAITK